MSWTDEEIDKLFQESAKEQTFVYDDAYFSEFEAAALPINGKGKDFLWMATAVLFIGVLTTGYFANTNAFDANGNSNQLATEKLKNQENQSLSNTEFDKTNNSTTNQLNNEALASIGQNFMTSANVLNEKKKNSFQFQPILLSDFNFNFPSYSMPTCGGVIYDPGYYLPSMNPTSMGVVDGLNASMITIGETVIKGLETEKTEEIDRDFDQNLSPSLASNGVKISPKSAFYVEANGGLSQSLITPSDNSSSSYGAGIGLETHLGRFSLNTGVNFQVSNHNDLKLSRAWKHYSFGSQSGMDNYDYRNVYTLEMPISLGYNLGRHRVTMGVRPSILLGAKIKHEAFEGESLKRSEEIYGLAGGLKRFGLKPMIGYSYKFGGKWTAGVNIGVQMLESINEDYIDGYNNKFPIDGQVYLRRSFRIRR